MGKIHIGILGGFQGKVGTVVGATWRGEDIIRAKPRKRTDNPTEQQMLQRIKFKAVSRFLNPLRDILGRYYGNADGVKSRYNLATSYHLTDAVAVTGEVGEMLYPRVMVAMGNLVGLQNPVAVAAQTAITVTWEDNAALGNAQAADTVTLVFYSIAEHQYFIYENIVLREALTAEVTLPENLLGTAVEGYAFVYDAKTKRASNSVYLGSISLA